MSGPGIISRKRRSILTVGRRTPFSRSANKTLLREKSVSALFLYLADDNRWPTIMWYYIPTYLPTTVYVRVCVRDIQAKDNVTMTINETTKTC